MSRDLLGAGFLGEKLERIEEPPIGAHLVVEVKSGGPALTVLSVDGDHVNCLFFSEELGEFKEAVIPAFALEAFDEDEARGPCPDDQDEQHHGEAPARPPGRQPRNDRALRGLPLGRTRHYAVPSLL